MDNEMHDQYVIAVDCGTQSVRALLFNQHGLLINKAKSEFEPYFSQRPGYAEQDPNIYFDHIIGTLSSLVQLEPQKSQLAQALCLTTLRDTGVYLNQEKKVVRPSMLWLDQRMANCDQPLPFKDRAMFKAVGMTRAIDITRRYAKVNWLKENEPQNWLATAHYVLLPAYLQYLLTGILVDSVGNQIGHVPFNYKTQSWPQSDRDYRWQVFGIDRHQLYALNKPGDLVGLVKDEICSQTGLPRGIKVMSGASDKGCETLGVGCINTKTASLSFGTTATVQTTSDKYFEPLMFMPAYPAAIPNYYNPEVQVFRGYWMIRWFKSEFAIREQQEALERGIAPEELLNNCLRNIPPGSNGLILQPFWTPGLKNPDAKGSIIGFNDSHTRAHLYRAIIEGINYGLIDGLNKIERKSKCRVEHMMVSGGGSQCDEICQITANMFNLPVLKGETYEAAGLGAAIIAFVGLGVHRNYEAAVKAMVRYKMRFEPEPKAAAIYNAIYHKIYTRIFDSLNPLYKELNRILDEQEDLHE